MALLRIALGFLCFLQGFGVLFLAQRSPLGGWLATLGVPQPHGVARALAILELVGGPLLMAGLLVVPITLTLLLVTVLGLTFGAGPRHWLAGGAGQQGFEHGLLLLASQVCLLLSSRGGRGR
jgi:uncharacterized membrane protein YphA (DoxX/SURF4 family)